MIVYRIEDRNGKGPYRNQAQYQWQNEDHDGHQKRPSIYRDEGFSRFNREEYHNDIDNWYFGFSSFAQLLEWFDLVELRRLFALGYVCKEITTDRIMHGQKQCVFKGRITEHIYLVDLPEERPCLALPMFAVSATL